MLNALLSGPNPKFNAFIERIKDDIDSGTGLKNHMSHDDLATAARAKYNNMVASDKYSKLDPKHAKIIDLTTKVTSLEWSVSANLTNVTSGGGSSGRYNVNQGDKIAGVDKWCTINKGATTQHEGKIIWWCLSYKRKYRLFDGLYIWNKPEDHDAWFEKFKSRISNKDKLQQLLRWLLQRHPYKDHLTNWRYLSASRKYYVTTSCYLTWTQMNTASKSVNKNISLRAGNMA